jgi:hypothetical protein
MGMLIAGLIVQTPVMAEEDAGDGTVEMTRASAKLAQAKARIRAYGADMEETDTDPFALSPLDTAGCDINIGNVVLDNNAEAPEEVVIFIEGDVIQSNNCR